MQQATGNSVVIQPAGAAGLAALTTYSRKLRGQLIGTILTGGNATRADAPVAIS